MTFLHSIRTWALIAVVVTSAALIVFAYRLIGWLAAPDWCGRAIAAGREGERPESAITGCFGLMTRQVEALALNSHLAIGVIGLALLVLVVIVLAGGKLSFTASRTGVSADIGRDAAEAARETANAAEAKADEFEGEVR